MILPLLVEGLHLGLFTQFARATMAVDSGAKAVVNISSPAPVFKQQSPSNDIEELNLAVAALQTNSNTALFTVQVVLVTTFALIGCWGLWRAVLAICTLRCLRKKLVLVKEVIVDVNAMKVGTYERFQNEESTGKAESSCIMFAGSDSKSSK